MVVLTLPVIGVVPPFEFFQIMNGIAIALGSVLLIAAVVSTLVVRSDPYNYIVKYLEAHCSRGEYISLRYKHTTHNIMP